MDPSRLQGANWTVQDVLTSLVISLVGPLGVYGPSHVRLFAVASNSIHAAARLTRENTHEHQISFLT